MLEAARRQGTYQSIAMTHGIMALVPFEEATPVATQTHTSIARRMVQCAETITRSHPSHPTTHTEILRASASCSRWGGAQQQRAIDRMRLVELESKMRDALWSDEIHHRVAFHEAYATFDAAVQLFLGARPRSSAVSIAAEVAVCKLMAEQEDLLDALADRCGNGRYHL